VLTPSGGEVLFKGENITQVEQAERVKRGIARTFQINRLFRGLSVLENVYMPIAERVGAAPDMFTPAGSRRDVIDEAMELLTRLKLADIAHKTIPELPYGRQRLVELAITLGLKPEVLLLDEPAAGVPSLESHRILDVLDKLPSEIAILIIEHDMDLVFRFARRITVLVQGEVLVEGTPEEIGRDKRVHQVYLGEQRHG
jgi:ABC-type branched-subunit amino acid transport system ATPase component